MSESSSHPTNPDTPPDQATIDAEALLQSLRRKEGNWVEWGQSCQALQKAGYNPQEIFEHTGFEPIQQNQVIVAAQVYGSLASGAATEPVLTHFSRKGSDILYEFRILTQPERVAAATLTLDKGLDADDAREVAKAVKELSRLPNLPEGFTAHPGDAVAYQCWKMGRQKTDLQERSRLIAKGLRFAHSAGARHRVEQLLTDLVTATPSKPAPRLPVYRLETDEYLPRLLPVAGKLPLTQEDWQAVPMLEESGPFQLVRFSGVGAWVAVPSWQVVRIAEDPVALLCDSDRLPAPLPGKPEEVLVVVDRAQREWGNLDADSYFVIAPEGQLQLQWFETTPETPLLGRVVLVMRPKKILDEDYTKELWQIDE